MKPVSHLAAVVASLGALPACSPQSALSPAGEDAERIAFLSWALFTGAAAILLIVVVALAIAIRGPETARRALSSGGMIRLGDAGLLRFELGGPDVRYVGSMLPIEGQVFVIATDTVRHLPCYMIYNIVTTPKIVLMDGILLTAGNAMRNPSAYPIVMERIGDLTGDKEADDAHAASLMRRPQFVQDEALVSNAMRDHLIRDFGPGAAKTGGDLLLTATGTPHLAEIVAALNHSG